MCHLHLVPQASLFSIATGYISYRIEGLVYTGAMRFGHTALAPIFITRLTGISGTNLIQEVKRKQVGCLCCAAGDMEW